MCNLFYIQTYFTNGKPQIRVFSVKNVFNTFDERLQFVYMDFRWIRKLFYNYESCTWRIAIEHEYIVENPHALIYTENICQGVHENFKHTQIKYPLFFWSKIRLIRDKPHSCLFLVWLFPNQTGFCFADQFKDNTIF